MRKIRECAQDSRSDRQRKAAFATTLRIKWEGALTSRRRQAILGITGCSDVHTQCKGGAASCLRCRLAWKPPRYRTNHVYFSAKLVASIDFVGPSRHVPLVLSPQGIGGGETGPA